MVVSVILADFLHCESISVTEGQQVRAGDLLAIGDNTGFTTGPHCHSQWRRERDHALPGPANAQPYRFLTNSFWLEDVDTNEANNSFDPTQFFHPFYAVDATQVQSLYERVAELAEMEVAALKAKVSP